MYSPSVLWFICKTYLHRQNTHPLFHANPQIFDATTNTWRVVDEKTRTDVLEKIVEGPQAAPVTTTVYVDDITDVRNVRNVTNISENVTDVTNVTNTRNVTNVNEQLIENLDRLNEVIDITNRNTKDTTVRKSSVLVDDRRRDSATTVHDRIDIQRKMLYEDSTATTVKV